MHTSFEDALNELTRKHKEFTREAYYFMREAIDYAAEQLNKETSQPNLSAKELYLGACSYALEEYGPMARKVLESWGIYTNRDFSDVVYNLIEAGVFGKQKDDSPSDFEKLEPLENVLNAPFSIPVDLAMALQQKEAQRTAERYDQNKPEAPYNNGTPSRSRPAADKTARSKTGKTAKQDRKATVGSKETPPATGRRSKKSTTTRDAAPPNDTDSPSDHS